jgi:hypothetical protein
MVLGRTGNRNFDIAVSACEATRQVSVLTATTQAQYNALDLAYYKCVVAAGLANGVSTETERLAVIQLSKGQPT